MFFFVWPGLLLLWQLFDNDSKPLELTTATSFAVLQSLYFVVTKKYCLTRILITRLGFFFFLDL